MNKQQAKQLADNAIENLAESLRQGKSENLVAYLKMVAMFHQYSFRNIALIASQCPHATHVAGFHAWRKLGRFVKKGQKGIAIIAPMVFKNSQDNHDDDTEQVYTNFRAVYVFDVSQTEGQEIPDMVRAKGQPREYLANLKDYIEIEGIGLDYVDELHGAEGTSSIGKIKLLNNLEPAEEFSTLVHELAHEMMHTIEDRKTKSNKILETEAEAVAFVVSESIGLEISGSSTDYIHMYDGDAGLLEESLDRIVNTAASIIQAITAGNDMLQQAA